MGHYRLHLLFSVSGPSPYPYLIRESNTLAGDSRQLRQDGVCMGCGFEASAVQAARALRQRQRSDISPQPADHRLCFIRQDGEDMYHFSQLSEKKSVYAKLKRTVACHMSTVAAHALSLALDWCAAACQM